MRKQEKDTNPHASKIKHKKLETNNHTYMLFALQMKFNKFISTFNKFISIFNMFIPVFKTFIPKKTFQSKNSRGMSSNLVCTTTERLLKITLSLHHHKISHRKSPFLLLTFPKFFSQKYQVYCLFTKDLIYKDSRMPMPRLEH